MMIAYNQSEDGIYLFYHNSLFPEFRGNAPIGTMGYRKVKVLE